MTLEPWQMALAALGALLVGVSKTGIGGLSLLFVAIFSQVIPSRQATGFVLPLLIIGDLMAVKSYRQHTQWRHVWRMFPWAAAGVIIGALTIGHINDRQARVMIGGIVLGMVALHLWRRRKSSALESAAASLPIWFGPVIGVLAGFTTLIANAAGPLMAIYLLAMQLPKMEYMGTGAVFFMLLNWFKVPFMIGLGLITVPSASFNLLLAPVVVAGALLGRWLLGRIDQKLFENLALFMSVLAGLNLLR